MMDVKKTAEEQEIWDKEEEMVKLEQDAKELVSLRFYKWIYVFRKKVNKKMLVKKMWNYTIELKEGKDLPIVRREERRSVQIH